MLRRHTQVEVARGAAVSKPRHERGAACRTHVLVAAALQACMLQLSHRVSGEE